MLGDANIIPVERRLLHRGAKFDFEALTFPDAAGRPLTREVVRHPGSVIILPLLNAPGAAEIVLIRNWRASLERWLWELPAGTRARDEEPEHCAARELVEETGYQAATLTPALRFHTSPGLSDELMWAYIATDLSPVGQRLEADERVEVRPMAISEAMRLIDQGEMTDAKSILLLLWAQRRGILRERGV